MLKDQEITIGNIQYQVTQLPLGKARPLLVKLTNLLGPAIGEALSGVQGGSLGDVDLKAIGAAVKALAYQISDDDFLYVQNAILPSCKFRNDEGHWVPLQGAVADNHFAGEMGRLFKLLGFALKVNYESFLVDLGLAEMFQPAASRTKHAA